MGFVTYCPNLFRHLFNEDNEYRGVDLTSIGQMFNASLPYFLCIFNVSGRKGTAFF